MVAWISLCQSPHVVKHQQLDGKLPRFEDMAMGPYPRYPRIDGSWMFYSAKYDRLMVYLDLAL